MQLFLVLQRASPGLLPNKWFAQTQTDYCLQVLHHQLRQVVNHGKKVIDGLKLNILLILLKLLNGFVLWYDKDEKMCNIIYISCYEV